MNKKLFGQWKLTACLNSASVLRWLLGMGCFRFWGLHVGGNGVLFFARGKKKYIKVFQSCLPTLPAYFPFETSFFGNLGASKVHQRTISPEITKTCWPDKSRKKYGGDAVLIKKKKCFIGHFFLK
jgi:hypothetical protein